MDDLIPHTHNSVDSPPVSYNNLTDKPLGGTNTWNLIETRELTGAQATVSFTIPSGYRMIKITGYARLTGADGDTLNVRFNSDSGTDYANLVLKMVNGATAVTDNTHQGVIYSSVLGGPFTSQLTSFTPFEFLVHNSETAAHRTGKYETWCDEYDHGTVNNAFRWTGSPITNISFSFQYTGSGTVAIGSTFFVEGAI